MDTPSIKNITPQYVEVRLVLRLAEHAESIQVMDTFNLDQSYLPILLTGLKEMIEW